MKILVCGGDERSVITAQRLAGAGMDVMCYCMDKAELPNGCRCVSEPEKCGAVVLPIPAEDERGFLNAPLGTAPCRTEYILDAAGEGAAVIGGRLGRRLKNAAADRGQKIYDILHSPVFAAKNAAVTAEGAVSELMRVSDTALCDMNILVVGWGRIGKLLIRKMHALCRSVCLMSVNPEARALADNLGCRAVSPDCPIQELECFDAVINTAPAPVVSRLCAFKKSCVLLELASSPGGIDSSEALSTGLKLLTLGALPGRYAPRSAAEAVFRAVTEILKEHDNDE